MERERKKKKEGRGFIHFWGAELEHLKQKRSQDFDRPRHCKDAYTVQAPCKSEGILILCSTRHKLFSLHLFIFFFFANRTGIEEQTTLHASSLRKLKLRFNGHIPCLFTHPPSSSRLVIPLGLLFATLKCKFLGAKR